ncbi:methyltransferase family protein [Flavobacteriaceae bacterium M23B6Z8]
MKLTTKDLLLVTLQFILFGLYFLDFSFFKIDDLGIISHIGLIIAIGGSLVLIISLLQLNKNLSPFPTPKDNGILIQNGLYAHIRHPIYTGILFVAFGMALYVGSIYKIGIGFLLCLLFHYKTKYEEELLLQKFKEYEMYMLKTGRFIPK